MSLLQTNANHYTDMDEFKAFLFRKKNDKLYMECEIDLLHMAPPVILRSTEDSRVLLEMAFTGLGPKNGPLYKCDLEEMRLIEAENDKDQTRASATPE